MDFTKLTEREKIIILKAIKQFKDYFVINQDFEGAAELRDLLKKIDPESYRF
jgi:protein-arginine kinase activator protein McsA